jgi:peptide/nickel transport system permease protein
VGTETVAPKFLIRVARAATTLLLAGVLGGFLVTFSPGSDIDDRELDPRRSQESVEAIRRERLAGRSPFRFLAALLQGDAGSSIVFGQPVAELIRERLPVTVRTVAAGLVWGWLPALITAAATAMHRRTVTTVAAISFSGVLLSCPSAVLAIACLLLRLPVSLAIAAIVFPRVFSHAHEQFRSALDQSHAVMARSCGIAGPRLFFYHVAPLALEPLIALAGVTITLAAGASIPVEALADSPGLGQLTWKSALGRDMPLLVSTTLLLATLTVTVNLVCDAALLWLKVRRT